MAFIVIGDKNELTIFHDYQGIDIFEVQDENLDDFKRNGESYDWLDSNAMWHASVLAQDGNLIVNTRP